MKILRLYLVLICLAVSVFEQCLGHNSAGRVTELIDSKSLYEWKHPDNIVRENETQSLHSKAVHKPLKNIKSKEYDLKRNISKLDAELLRVYFLLDKLRLATEAEDEDESMRIVFDKKAREDGFTLTTPRDFPYSVLLTILTTRSSELCTGSLITPRVVLTAAHCFVKGHDSVMVYAGGNSLQELVDRTYPPSAQLQLASQVHVHPEFEPNNKLLYDIALIEVGDDFRMTDSVNTVRLSMDSWRYGGYAACQLTGFGTVRYDDESEDDKKRKSHFLEVSNNCECLHNVDRAGRLVMCSRPKEDVGICSGDSGGGLVCHGKVVALAKGFIPYRDIDTCSIDRLVTKECGVRNSLNFFQQVCPYLHWISCHVESISKEMISNQCHDPRGNDNCDDFYDDLYDNEDRRNWRLPSSSTRYFPFVPALALCQVLLLMYRSFI